MRDMSKTVGIVGLGLLGGSLAKALHERSDYRLIGYARRAEVCAAALDDGVVEAARIAEIHGSEGRHELGPRLLVQP